MHNIHKAMLITLALPLVIYAGAVTKAHAMNTPVNYSSSSNSSSSNNSSCSNSTPKPYTGGASVAKFYAMPDGSGVTVTSTGAVIKQSPCQTPYREGWVNPSTINCANITPQIQPGDSNPYVYNTSGCYNSTNNNCCSSSATPSTSAQTTYIAPVNTVPAPAPATVTTYTTPAASTPQPVASTTYTTSSASSKPVTTLPNTGPGNILMVGTVASALGGASHFLYKRFRYS